jgi:hypothetical protein
MLETRRCSDNGPFVQRVPEPLADRLGTRSAFRVKTGLSNLRGTWAMVFR